MSYEYCWNDASGSLPPSISRSVKLMNARGRIEMSEGAKKRKEGDHAMTTGFWVRQNTWWREMIQKMTSRTTTAEDWNKACGDIWCLSFLAAPQHHDVVAEERRDLVQEALLRLQ